jgi:hypothetical protein
MYEMEFEAEEVDSEEDKREAIPEVEEEEEKPEPKVAEPVPVAKPYEKEKYAKPGQKETARFAEVVAVPEVAVKAEQVQVPIEEAIHNLKESIKNNM